MSITEHRILGDYRGQLVAIEERQDVPFDVKRVFYIFSTQLNATRGEHSHYRTRQYLIAVNGSCKVTLDDGKQAITYDLNQPNIGLLQDALVWGTMHDFTPDCVLLVLASEPYDAADYICDYDDFRKVVGV